MDIFSLYNVGRLSGDGFTLFTIFFNINFVLVVVGHVTQKTDPVRSIASKYCCQEIQRSSDVKQLLRRKDSRQIPSTGLRHPSFNHCRI